MAKPDLMPLAEEERGELLALLDTLTPDQWAAPTLCERWTVRDVAVHVVSYDELSVAQTARAFVRGGFRPAAVNEVVLRSYDGLEPAGVVSLVASCRRPRGLPAALKGGIALTDGTIHHQDIRRALGLRRTIAADQLAAVLDFSLTAPTLPSKGNARGLRLVADDLDWSSGTGPEVSGPGEALLMAAAGRREALHELDGDGLEMLRRRVGGTTDG